MICEIRFFAFASYPPHLFKRTGTINVIRPVFWIPKYIDSNGILDIFKGKKRAKPIFTLF